MTVVTSMRANAENVTIEQFEVDMEWKSMAFKFDRIAGRFSTLADLTINQVRYFFLTNIFYAKSNPTEKIKSHAARPGRPGSEEGEGQGDLGATVLV